MLNVRAGAALIAGGMRIGQGCSSMEPPAIESASPCNKKPPAPGVFHVVILHDDYLTARRGRLLARGIAREMGGCDEFEMKLWNVELLGTLFGRAAAVEASTADIVVVALRSPGGFPPDLKLWLGRWFAETKEDSIALIAVFEDYEEPAVIEARAFLQNAAQGAGKDFFSQQANASGRSARGHECLWVL